MPDDPGHLVAIELDHRICDLDLRHVSKPLPAQRRRARAYIKAVPERQFASMRPPRWNTYRSG
jgi:hypothetical protein